MNYYNEHDPKAAAWLRELIKEGHIPAGIVDERSITEIKPHELDGFTQCHFFAGIGGWSLALELAGWPPDAPVWTGSCPCQPFSSAGKHLAEKDERHLWPVFFDLIRQCRPERVFGEQVASAIGKGWLDGVSADLEEDGYAVGAAVLGAHSVGAPHIRQRLYWVADCLHGRSQNGWPGGHGQDRGSDSQGGANTYNLPTAEKLRATGGMDKPEIVGPEERPQLHGKHDGQKPANGCEPLRMGNAESRGFGECGDEAQSRGGRHAIGASWARFEVVHCRDGKARRFEPESFPLADGVPGRVGLLRGYGNAIVPQVAAEFILAFIEVTTTATNPTTA